MRLIADVGTYLTQKANVDISERLFRNSVYLTSSEEALEWKQVTEAEKIKILSASTVFGVDELDSDYLSQLETVIEQVPNIINSKNIAANDALKHKGWYPYWGQTGAEYGKQVEAGFRFRYKSSNDDEDTLYEVLQPHSLSAEWIPSIDTASLYKIVTQFHEGTMSDPIPYEQGMVIEKNKYYTQNGDLYVGIMTTLTGYPYDLSELFTLVQKINMETDNEGVSAAPSVSELL